MANSVPSPESVIATGNAPDGKGGLGIRRSELLLEQRTGATGEKGRGKKKESAEANEYVNLPADVREGYKRFLTDHLIALQRVQEKNQQALDNPLFAHDRRLLQLFYDADNKRVKDKELDNFLTKPEGYMVVTQLLESQMQIKMFALGIELSVTPPGTRREYAGITDEKGRRLGWNQGFFQRVLHPGMQPPEDPTRINPFDEGTKYVIRDNAAMFRRLQRDPAAVDYLFQTTGLQLKDFDYHHGTPGNPAHNIPATPDHITLNTHRTRESIIDPNKLRAEVMDHFNARNAFLDALHVDRSLRDASPVSFLYRGDTSRSPEQLGLVYEQRVMDKWQPNSGRRSTSRDTNIQKYMEAQSEVMADMVKEYLQRKEEPAQPLPEIKQKLAEKIRERKDTPDQVKAKEAAAHKKKIEEIDKDKTTLTSEETPLDAYQTTEKALRDARDRLQREFPGVADIDTEIQRLRDLLNPFQAGSYDSLIKQSRNNATRRYNSRTSRLAPVAPNDKAANAQRTKLLDKIAAEEDATFQREETYYKEQATKAREDIQKLQEIKTAIESARNELNDTQPVVRNTENKLSELTTARTEVTGFAAPGVASITDAELGDPAATVDTILSRINAIHAAGAAATPPVVVGWEASQNGEPAHRQQVLRAMLDARAEQTANADAARAGRVTEYTAVTTMANGITANQLRIMPDSQIAAETARLVAAGWAGGTEDRLRAARQEARDRVKLRVDAGKELDQQLYKQKEAEQHAIDSVNIEEGTNVLETTKDLLDRYTDKHDEFMTATWEVTDNQTVYTDRTRIAAGEPGYTSAEQAAARPKGYYEIMNLLFAYKDKPDREAYFRKISQVIDDRRLAELLNANLNLGMRTHRDDLDRTLQRLGTRISGNAIDSSDIARAFRGIVDTLKNQAMALP